MVFKIENDYSSCRYPSDVVRIVHVALEHGVVLSAQEAEKAWEEYSDSMAAGWIIMTGSNEYIWNSLPAWARGE